ncbi:MAG: hypothetical protein R3B70_13975 [Polyangiaceae bacterium]
MAPLAQDKPLLDWTVREVRAIDHGTLDVVCEKGPTRVILSVALASETGPEPPVQTERFAVFYSVRGERTEEGEKLARALAAVLDANKAVPVPPGLTVFVPRPRSL